MSNAMIAKERTTVAIPSEFLDRPWRTALAEPLRTDYVFGGFGVVSAGVVGPIARISIMFEASIGPISSAAGSAANSRRPAKRSETASNSSHCTQGGSFAIGSEAGGGESACMPPS